jgi:hypothetical protein
MHLRRFAVERRPLGNMSGRHASTPALWIAGSPRSALIRPPMARAPCAAWQARPLEPRYPVVFTAVNSEAAEAELTMFPTAPHALALLMGRQTAPWKSLRRLHAQKIGYPQRAPPCPSSRRQGYTFANPAGLDRANIDSRACVVCTPTAMELLRISIGRTGNAK